MGRWYFSGAEEREWLKVAGGSKARLLEASWASWKGLFLSNNSYTNTDWWFGTFLIFPYIGNNHPNWLSYFSEGLKPPTRIAGKMCWMMGFAGFSLSVPSVPCMETSPCFLPFAGQNLGTLVFASKQWVKLRKAGCPCSLIIYRGGKNMKHMKIMGSDPSPCIVQWINKLGAAT
jgi:hypothetical protein